MTKPTIQKTTTYTRENQEEHATIFKITETTKYRHTGTTIHT